MKRILISSCIFFLIIAGNQAIAQEKIKEKEDKTKIKTDSSKVKDKDNKTKIKAEGYKEKDKDNKTKIKDADGSKIKIKNASDTDPKSQMKMDQNGMNTNMNGMSNPYTAAYSSNFVMGNPEHSKMIVDMWKDWDDNAFERHDYMADTLVMYLPDGSMVKGKAANLEGAKKYRSGLASSKSTIQAWVPLRSTDRNEDWVAIWGTETDTWTGGKTETRQIHEIWRINKDGKVDLMRQYTATAPQQ